ncbi:MAG TPA: asparagine synthase-related protein [Chthoniobacterales bacterium]|nr:asparagine synthase-related protein [Chthoniobacterales bacterium]
MRALLKDVRKRRGTIWNVREVLKDYPFGVRHAPWNKGARIIEEDWIDEFVYLGFLAHGERFLRALRGRFATAWIDSTLGQLFLARDWIGEQPFHYIATLDCFIVGNAITDVKSAAGADYSYAYVRAFPQAHYQFIDLREVRIRAVSSSIRLSPPTLYFDFAQAVEDTRNNNASADLDSICELLRERLQISVCERMRAHEGRPLYLLLSGGLDSFSVALALKRADVEFAAVTLSVRGGGGDLEIARAFAKRLNLEHHVCLIEPEQVVEAFEASIQISECYHLYNIYCAVGMHLLGTIMKQRGYSIAFCGEAVNEAVGDYHDWTVTDPCTRQEIILQKINSNRLEKTEERVAYTWGKSVDAGLYNKQLGTGLAKHAGSRMYKPFHYHGLELEAPYYDRTVLQNMISLSAQSLRQVGGKPGLFTHIFQRDLQKFGIPTELVLNSKKVRFQDATEGGEGGITSVLHRQGLDQKRAINTFNRLFESHLDSCLETRRLRCTASA